VIVREISHREAKDLYAALVDAELQGDLLEQMRAHLDSCRECRDGWTRYSRAVEKVRSTPRSRAPGSFAAAVKGRVLRRRRGLRGLAHVQAVHRVPVEILVPILLAAAIAALVMFLT
jgi:anti-sigma factor RsiW